MSSIQVGDAAPDFTAEAQTGETVRLADFRGRQAVVLFFYPRDNTPTCTAEACAFRDAFEDFVAAGAVVIGVSGDSLQRHRGFAERQRLPFLLVSDADGAIRQAFGVPRTLVLMPGRVTYVIDRQGIVRHIFNSAFAAGQHVTEALAMVRQLVADD
jgi:peroxiredoxin Q/BCP